MNIFYAAINNIHTIFIKGVIKDEQQRNAEKAK